MAERLLLKPEVAARLGIPTATLAFWIHTGKFPAGNRKLGRASKWREADVDKWIRDQFDDAPSAVAG